MNVLIVTQYYPPETGALASRWGDFSKILANQGHEVTILCEAPHYPNSFYYPGFKNIFYNLSEECPGLKIIRVKAFASDRKTKIKKLTHYFTFVISAILNIRKIKKYQHIIVSTPPLFTGVIGLFIKRFYKKDYWLDIRDLWPDSALELGQLKKGKIYKLGKYLEKLIYTNSKGFIFPVPGFRNYLSKFPSIISKKPMIDLMNGVSKNFLEEAKKIDTKQKKKFTVLYSGNMGLAQDLNTIIEAASQLSSYEIYFELIGNGVCKSEIHDIANKKSIKVKFYDSKPRKELIKSILKSSVCLVPLKNKKLFNYALPSKMFEYMACEKPVILGVDGEAKKLINDSQSGIFVHPEDPKMLSEAILTYFHTPKKVIEHGKNGFNFITKNLKKEDLISNLFKEINKYHE